MKINNFRIKHSYKPERIISDVLSLGIAAVIVISTLNFFPIYKQTVNERVREHYELLMIYRESLSYRQYFAWIFPALAAVIFAVYLILVLKSHKFAGYKVTEECAQSVYDRYSFAVSLCKIPLLLIVFNVMYIFQQRIMFNEVSIFSVSVILYALMVVIIIRLSVHRIRGVTEREKEVRREENGRVKAKIAPDDEDSD